MAKREFSIGLPGENQIGAESELLVPSLAQKEAANTVSKERLKE
jgi:hypothetical protein